MASVSSIGASDPNAATSALTQATTKQLGKDDFLKLLLTQLRYQDSEDPVKDKEFIAQMAQFSALEQTTNMTKSFEKLSTRVQNNEALSILGQKVSAVHTDDGATVEGVVTAIKFTKDDPEVTIAKQDQSIAVVKLSEVTGASLR